MASPYKEKESSQNSLFEEKDIKKGWENEWQDMPEFHQKKVEPHATIIVRFRNEEDLQKFATLTDQNLNNKSKSMWYPKLEIQDLHSTRYIDKKNET